MKSSFPIEYKAPLGYSTSASTNIIDFCKFVTKGTLKSIAKRRTRYPTASLQLGAKKIKVAFLCSFSHEFIFLFGRGFAVVPLLEKSSGRWCLYFEGTMSAKPKCPLEIRWSTAKLAEAASLGHCTALTAMSWAVRKSAVPGVP